MFVDLYKKGKVYRGVRVSGMGSQRIKSALSDEEVIQKKSTPRLWPMCAMPYNEPTNIVTIATTRPETFGRYCCFQHPDDERYQHLKFGTQIVPLNRIVPIILDEHIDIEFGTGALKVIGT